MGELGAALQEAVGKAMQREEKVRQILLEAYGYDKNKHEGKPSTETQDMGIKLLAADVGTRLFNVLFAVRNPNAQAGYTAIMDLTVNLNNNAFWVKNGPVLMPLLHMALAAQADYATLAVEKASDPNITKDDEVRAESKLVGLELFSMIAFLVGGQAMMQAVGLKLKRKLAPLIG